MRLDRPCCDTRFFGVTLDFYRKHFFGRVAELDDSQNKLIEFMFFDSAKKAAQERKVIRRFKTEPVQTALLQVNDYSGLGSLQGSQS